MRGERMGHAAHEVAVHRAASGGAHLRRESVEDRGRHIAGGTRIGQGRAVPVASPRRGALAVGPQPRNRANALRMQEEKRGRGLSETVLVILLALFVLAMVYGASWILQVQAGLR